MRNDATKNVRAVKAALAHRGTTLAGWARAKGYPMTTVWQAVHEIRSGKTAVKIRAELKELTNA